MIYVLFFSYLIIGAISLDKNKSKWFLKIAMIFMAAIIGLRSTEVGVDTLSYVDEFKYYTGMDFSNLMVIIRESKEPFFVLGSWFVSSMIPASVFFTFFWGTFPCVALYYMLKDEVPLAQGQLVSVLCLFALGLFAFFMAGMRQTAAISLVLLAYRALTQGEIKYKLSFLKSKQFIKFALLMLAAYNIHNSSILFLLVLPILKLRVRWWYLLGVIGLFFAVKNIQVEFITKMAALFFEDRFANYGTVYESSQSINSFIMQFILFVICYLKRKTLIKRDYKNSYLFNIMVVGLAFQSLSGMIYEMARVSFYFSIFAVILVPKAIEEYSIHQKKVLYIGFTFLILIYLFFLSSANLPQWHTAIFL